LGFFVFRLLVALFLAAGVAFFVPITLPLVLLLAPRAFFFAPITSLAFTDLPQVETAD
jgi:hypothetical protein